MLKCYNKSDAQLCKLFTASTLHVNKLKYNTH